MKKSANSIRKKIYEKRDQIFQQARQLARQIRRSFFHSLANLVGKVASCMDAGNLLLSQPSTASAALEFWCVKRLVLLPSRPRPALLCTP